MNKKWLIDSLRTDRFIGNFVKFCLLIELAIALLRMWNKTDMTFLLCGIPTHG